MDKTRFNPEHPHGHIYGLPGVAFEQDGKLFTARGCLVDPVTLAESRLPPVLTLRQQEILGSLSRDALLAFRWLQRGQPPEATANDLVRSGVVSGAALVRCRRIFGELVQAGLAEWKTDNLLRIVANPAAPDWESDG